MEMTEEKAFIQNKIDTYLTGASILAVFLDKKERSAEQKKDMMAVLNTWLLKAENLTEQVTYINASYLILFYHNVAYVYWNIEQYEQALTYINCALSVPSPDKSLAISDLKLRAQIYHGMYMRDNEYLSEETGMLSVDADSANTYLILAGKDLKEAMELQQQLLHQAGSFSYFTELAGLHFVMSQNLGYRGDYENAIEEIDRALELENQVGGIQDLYATYYQAAMARFGAYNQWKKKQFLTEILACLNQAEQEILCSETAGAYYYLEDLQQLRRYVLTELER